MKTQKLLLAVLICTIGFVSCKKDEKETKTFLITFEDVKLGSSGYWNGSDLTGTPKDEQETWGMVTNYYGSFFSYHAEFTNKFTPSDWGDSWKGFACSKLTDTETPGYVNEYSVITGEGANRSEQFAVAFSDEATFHYPKNMDGYSKIKSVMMTNSTYAYIEIRDGGLGKKFGAGDWFKVTIKGYKNNNETGAVDYYLADFRDGKEFISNKWEKVDVSSLGEVDKVMFFFESTDIGDYGMNTPAYVCIDNIEFEQEIIK